MKVTYPHMGYLTIPIANMLTNLGVEVVEAPPITKKTIELGSFYSPEGVCLPYKITMGNFVESMERGADTFVTVCGAGKCRLGFYNTVQKIRLSEKKPIQFLTIDTNKLFSELYSFLRTAAPHAGKADIVRNIALAIKTLKALDDLNNAKNVYGAQADCPEKIIDMYQDGIRQFSGCYTSKDIDRVHKNAIALMHSACGDNKQSTAKVALIGEFYVLLEPWVNQRIEDLLLKQGIEVKKFVYAGEWAYSNTLLQGLGLYNEEKAYSNQAKPYLNYHVGGDGLKSVGSALWCARHGFDGIIHIYPFGCMPEVVAQYALKNIANDYHLPLLSLSVDEHSSDVGTITRIEAFADCIKRKEK